MAEITRPPVVTILGHVDHGKTTLLDYIRKSAVAASEHGGITQAIGAYQVEIPKESKSRESEANRGILRLPPVAQDDLAENRKITFIDTPGHAAFEKMRERGAQLADIAVLVVAIDDGVMPQTVEAIKHIEAANIPMIVALNKIDLPSVEVKIQTEKIKKQLSDQKVLVEEYGGDVPLVPLSAKTGKGVPELLETISLVAEIHELKGDPNKKALGTVIESKLDRFRGSVATILVRDGSLNKGETVTVGGVSGKIRGMFDFTGKAVDVAGLSVPVEVLGFESVPPVGGRLGEEERKEGKLEPKVLSLIDKLKEKDSQTLNVVIRADKQGSLEAVEGIVEKLNAEKQLLKVVEKGTGEIVDSDIKIAAATRAIVVGFNSVPRPSAKKLAETENVLVRTYNIIYELADELEDVVEGMLKPGKVEEVFGRCQIIAEFPYGKGEKIAGCKIVEGAISKGSKVRVVRSEEVVGEAKIKSMKRLKEEVTKAEKGQECGLLFDPIIDFQIGDVVESFRTL